MSNAASVSPVAKDFFGILEKLYVFLTSSHPRLEKFNEAERRLSEEVQNIQLKRLVDTRWSCRNEAVRAIKATYPAILEALEDIEENEGKPTEAAEAMGSY